MTNVEKTSIGKRSTTPPTRNDTDNREAEKPAQRERRRHNRGNGVLADWASVSPESIARAIGAVTREGRAIRFGYSRDKGAFAIGIIGDGDPYTEFVRPTEDIVAYLSALAGDFEDDGEPAL